MKPITSCLPELSDGVMIVVQGTLEKEEDGKFILDFGHSKKTSPALRICVTFASQIVLSVQMAEDKGFSFQRGFLRTGVLRFEVIVLVSDVNFKISLNGCHVCEAPYLFPLKEINRLEVNGNVQLHRIFCQRPCQADQQVNGDHKASEKVPGTLGVLHPAESKLPAGSVIHKSQPHPEISRSNSEPPRVGNLNAPSVRTDASSETNLSKLGRSTQIRDVSEADLSNQRSDADLKGDCLNLGLSTGDTPKSETDAQEAACWSIQSPSIPGRSERPGSHMESDSNETSTTSDRFELPYAFPSPQTPAAPVSSAGPNQNPPTGLAQNPPTGLAQNPLMPNRLDAPYPPAQYTQSQNPVMLDQSKTHSPYPGPPAQYTQSRNPVMLDQFNAHSPYPGHMPNQNADMRGNSNAPYPYPGYAYPQNPVHPGQWNAPYPLPSNTSSQNPGTTCQSAVPLHTYPYQGYTPNLYPPLPNVSAAPYLHSGCEPRLQNPVIPSYGPHPAYNPNYSAPLCPNYNQQPGTPNWTHSNMKYLPGGLKLDQVINIYGDLLQNPSGFSVLMSNGEADNANVFLNMVVSFPERMVSRSRKMYNLWSQVENSLSHFPFQAGKPFHVAIVCCYNSFRVFGNETHLFDFQVSMNNLSEITSVKIYGMVTTVNIAVN